MQLQFNNRTTCSQTFAAAVPPVGEVLGVGSFQGSLICFVFDDLHMWFRMREETV